MEFLLFPTDNEWGIAVLLGSKWQFFSLNPPPTRHELKFFGEIKMKQSKEKLNLKIEINDLNEYIRICKINIKNYKKANNKNAMGKKISSEKN